MNVPAQAKTKPLEIAEAALDAAYGHALNNRRDELDAAVARFHDAVRMTGADVERLRVHDLELSRRLFGRLIGVSDVTIGNWEGRGSESIPLLSSIACRLLDRAIK